MNKFIIFLSVATVATVAGFGLTTMLTSANPVSSLNDESMIGTANRKQFGFMHKNRKQPHDFGVVQDAIEANDYAAFQTAVADSPFAEQIDTQEKFTKFVELHTLKQAGDYEGAQALATELGLPNHRGGKEGGCKGNRFFNKGGMKGRGEKEIQNIQ